MKVGFAAGFGPIIRDADAAHAFWRDGLGIEFEEPAPGYFTNDSLDGVKAFAMWPLSQAAEATFGSAEWPEDLATLQAWMELGTNRSASEVGERDDLEPVQLLQALIVRQESRSPEPSSAGEMDRVRQAGSLRSDVCRLDGCLAIDAGDRDPLELDQLVRVALDQGVTGVARRSDEDLDQTENREDPAACARRHQVEDGTCRIGLRSGALEGVNDDVAVDADALMRARQLGDPHRSISSRSSRT